MATAHGGRPIRISYDTATDLIADEPFGCDNLRQVRLSACTVVAEIDLETDDYTG